jgi:hypothetical protein
VNNLILHASSAGRYPYSCGIVGLFRIGGMVQYLGELTRVRTAAARGRVGSNTGRDPDDDEAGRRPGQAAIAELGVKRRQPAAGRRLVLAAVLGVVVIRISRKFGPLPRFWRDRMRVHNHHVDR